ncbi:MAG: hypothetical protein IKN04_04265 [Clostridia bacterium]|nr:hypothetical protein [Clostridia bacterium]
MSLLDKKKRMNSSTKQRFFWIAVAILITVAIFFFSPQSMEKSEDPSNGVAGLLNTEQGDTEIGVLSQRLFFGLTFWKLTLLFLYTLLGFSLHFVFEGVRGRFFWAAGIGFAECVLNELYQTLEGGFGGWGNILIGAGGILVGIGFAFLVVFLLRTLRKVFEKADSKRLARVERILDILSLIAVMHYTFYRFLHSTMFSFYYATSYKAVTILLLLLAGGVRFLYIVLKKCWTASDPKTLSHMFLRYALAFCLAVPFVYVGLLHDYNWLIPIPFAVLCLYDMDAQKICRTFVVTIGILVGALVLCSLSGTVRNLVNPWEAYRNVSAFGTINTSDFGSYFTFLLITAWCGLRNRKWYTAILFTVLVVGVSYWVWWNTDSRTVYYSGALLIIFVLWDCVEARILRKNKVLHSVGRGINWLSPAAFPLLGGLVFWLAIRYGMQDTWALEVEKTLNGRLSIVWNSLCANGVHPFGSTMASAHGLGGTYVGYWSSGYGYIDVAYGMLAIQYGWVITAIVTGAWVWMTIRALRHGNNRIAFAMVILAFHALSETRILDLNYNIFLAMPFCAMAVPEKSLQAETERIKEERPIWVPIMVGMVLAGGTYLLLPRGLSWLRTFFSLKGWNSGTAAFDSFAVCVALLLMLWLLWKVGSLLCFRRDRMHIAFMAGVILLLGGTLLIVNRTIEQGLEAQTDRLEKELPIVAQVQAIATMPVYAAEQEELYQRSGTNISEHVFLTDQLIRQPRGSIFVDRDVEALQVCYRGGKYTQISEWSGLYTFDPAVIEALSNQGYEWKSYYSGRRSVNLRDTALFNGKTLEMDSLSLGEGERVETKNMKTDFYSGTYEICFSLSSLHITEHPLNNQAVLLSSEGNNPWKDQAVCLELVGEDGDIVLHQEWLSTDAFDEKGECTCTLTCSISSCPMVFFAVETAENVCVTIEEITWQRIS